MTGRTYPWMSGPGCGAVLDEVCRDVGGGADRPKTNHGAAEQRYLIFDNSPDKGFIDR